MDKQERKVVVAVQMELSDMFERLMALHEYVTEFLNEERKNDVENPKNLNGAGK